MIIDTHSHLGDLLFGENITFKQNVVKRDHHNYLERLEANDNMPYPELIAEDPVVLAESILNEEQARNSTATLQNMQSSLDRNGIDQIWVLPVLPRVGFEEILAASKLEPRIVPFTCIDFSLDSDSSVEKLLKDAESGAGGLKVHPVIQQRRMNDPFILKALDAWKATGKPVIFHTYAYEYYHPENAQLNSPEYGSNADFVELVRAYPELTMIAAHAGGPFDFAQILEGKDLDNLYVDVSFQSEESIRMFIEGFGASRVLLGSDWPWGCQETPIRILKRIVGENKELSDLLFYKNAQRILSKEC